MATNPSVVQYQRRLAAIRNSKQKAKGAGLMKALAGGDFKPGDAGEGKPALFFGNYPIPSALKPRENPDYVPSDDPMAQTGPQYVPTKGLGGWFRQLLGDNANELNARSAAERAQLLKEEWLASKAQERAMALLREQQKGTMDVEQMRLKSQEGIHRDDRLFKSLDHNSEFMRQMAQDDETRRHNMAVEGLTERNYNSLDTHRSELERYKQAMAQIQAEGVAARNELNAWKQGAPMNIGGTPMRNIDGVWHAFDAIDPKNPRWLPIAGPGQTQQGDPEKAMLLFNNLRKERKDINGAIDADNAELRSFYPDAGYMPDYLLGGF